MKIGLRDVEYFAAIAEHRHIGRAAEALGLSQPALSRSLGRLETSIAAKLVTRTPKGVELTAVGSALLARVRPLRLAVDDVLREATELSQGVAGAVRVGVGPAAADHFLPKACAALFRETARVTVKSTIGPHRVIMPALLSGEVDLLVSGIGTPADDRVVREHLYDVGFAVVVSARHRLASRKSVTLNELAAERWTGSSQNDMWPALQRAFEQQGLPAPDLVFDALASLPTLELVADSELVGFVSRQVLQRATPRLGVVELAVKGCKWSREMGMSYRKNAYLSPVVLRFMEIVRATAKRINSSGGSRF